jgi:hypothetical protein
VHIGAHFKSLFLKLNLRFGLWTGSSLWVRTSGDADSSAAAAVAAAHISV